MHSASEERIVDLQHYRAPCGAFQLVTPDRAIFLIVIAAPWVVLFFGG